MGEVFMNWQELAAAYRKLKADHDALRKLVDQMANAIENHVHSLDGMWAVSGKPVKRPSTPPAVSSQGAERTREPGAPAEG